MDSYKISLLESIAEGCVKKMERTDEHYSEIILYGGEAVEMQYLQGYLMEKKIISLKKLKVSIINDYNYSMDFREGVYSLDLGFVREKLRS